MKKRAICLVLAVFLLLLAAGCKKEPPTPSGELIRIDLAGDEFLSTFDNIHEFNLMPVRETHLGIVDMEGDRLVIWTDRSLKDVRLVTLGSREEDEKFVSFITEHYDTIDELSPGMAYVIGSYIDAGMLPWLGVAFLDEDDVQRCFSIVQDQSDEFPPYRLIEFAYESA